MSDRPIRRHMRKPKRLYDRKNTVPNYQQDRDSGVISNYRPDVKRNPSPSDGGTIPP